jgi:hypothetical protein
MRSLSPHRQIFKVAAILVAVIVVAIICAFLINLYPFITLPKAPVATPTQPKSAPAIPVAIPSTEPPPVRTVIRATPVVEEARTNLPPLIQNVVAPKMDIQQRIAPGKVPRKLVPGIRRAGVTNAPNPYATFRTTPERVMSQLLRTPPGNAVLLAIPLGPDFDQEFSASLKNMIEIYETDTPEEENHKNAVGWMKEELRKMAEEGKSPTKVITEYRQQLNELAALRMDLQRQLTAYKKAGDMESAALFLVEANKMLEPYGARPLTLTPTVKKQTPQE